MRIIVSSLLAASLLSITASAGFAQSPSQGRNGEARDCVVTGWTDWSLTRPIFKCPEANGNGTAKHRRR